MERSFHGAVVVLATTKETLMKLSVLAITAAVLVASSPLALAANGGAKADAPGQMMQKYGSVPGSPGASGYAPGHLKRTHVVRSVSRSTRRVTTGMGVH
jgi:hypothetical protein